MTSVIPFVKGSKTAVENCEPGLVMHLDGSLWWLRSDGSEEAVPGSGGSQLVTESANYSGNPVPLVNGATGPLGWGILDGGTDVLDRTDPLLPVARKDGLYIISAQVQPSAAFTGGGAIACELTFDYTDAALLISAYQVAGADGGITLLIGGSYVLTAGQAIQISASNLDGSADRSLLIKNSFVSRIGPA